MVQVTILRGFKMPIAVLNAFLNSAAREDNVENSDRLVINPSENADLEEVSEFLSNRFHMCHSLEDYCPLRAFIPHRGDHDPPDHAYIAYASITAYAQRKIDLARELPDKPPAGFADFRREILSGSTIRHQPLLQVEGCCRGWEGEVEDLSAGLYVLVNEDQENPPARGPLFRTVSGAPNRYLTSCISNSALGF
jgi:hypothetical protein